MKTYSAVCWHEANQAYLVRALDSVRTLLKRRGDRENSFEPMPEPGQTPADAGCSGEGFAPPALERLCAAFGLSNFEREIVLMCAGVELDSSFAEVLAESQNDPRRNFPTFALALGAFPDAHWSALSPAAPLRRWRLIETGAGDSLTGTPIRLDEQVLHYLAGVPHMDDRLRGMLEHVPPPADLPESHQAHARAIATAWAANVENRFPAIQLCGKEFDAKRAVAAGACAMVHAGLYSIQAQVIPNRPAELDAFLRLWQRETLLNGSSLLIDCDQNNDTDAARDGAIARILEEVQGCLVVSNRGTNRMLLRRPTITFEVAKPTTDEQRAIWRSFLGEAAIRLNGSLGAIEAQFDFSSNAIRTACVNALQPVNEGRDLASMLWEACRAQARPRLDDLAQRIKPAASWEDLILPEPQKQVLRQIEIHVRQRTKVYQTWGFAARGSRGLGISALFAGPSGTGKTMAGEVLASELDLDLYRIDLARSSASTSARLRRICGASSMPPSRRRDPSFR